MRVHRHLTRNYLGLVYIAPWVLGLLVFQLYPFVYSLVLSFMDKSFGATPRFTGIQNYVYMFTRDRLFWNSVERTLIYVLIAVPGRVLFALMIALILNSDIPGMNLFRTIYYLPSIFAGGVAISIVWRFLFQNQGAINLVLEFLSLEPVSWFGNPKVALYVLGIIPIWQFGSSMVLFLAALKNVPRVLYEAAHIDGAGRIRTFLRITLPMISPIILFNVVVQTIGAFQDFSSAFVITGGGPNKSTYLYSLLLYDQAFTNFRMGYASALSWVLFVVILLFTGIMLYFSRYWTFYSDGKEGI